MQTFWFFFPVLYVIRRIHNRYVVYTDITTDCANKKYIKREGLHRKMVFRWYKIINCDIVFSSYTKNRDGENIN